MPDQSVDSRRRFQADLPRERRRLCSVSGVDRLRLLCHRHLQARQRRELPPGDNPIKIIFLVTNIPGKLPEPSPMFEGNAR